MLSVLNILCLPGRKALFIAQGLGGNSPVYRPDQTHINFNAMDWAKSVVVSGLLQKTCLLVPFSLSYQKEDFF